MGSTALTNAVCAVQYVNKSSLKIWYIVPDIWETFPKKAETSRNFHFITSYLPKNFASLPIPYKIVRFPEEFCFSPKTDLLRVDTPRFYLLSNRSILSFKNRSLVFLMI